MPDTLIDANIGDTIRIGFKRRLNGPFTPFYKQGNKLPLVEVMCNASSSALRLIRVILQELNDDHVAHVAVNPVNNVDYRSLELMGVVRRLSADEYPRMRGHVSVMVSPYMICSASTKVLDRWNSFGLSPQLEEL